MNVAHQAAQYSKDLALARHQLHAVRVFDRTVLRASRIADLFDRVQTLELALDLCQREDAQLVEDLAAA